MKLDQNLWNALFGWLVKGRCMLPEGCTVPVEGVLFYSSVVIFLIALMLRREKLIEGLMSLKQLAGEKFGRS